MDHVYVGAQAPCTGSDHPTRKVIKGNEALQAVSMDRTALLSVQSTCTLSCPQWLGSPKEPKGSAREALARRRLPAQLSTLLTTVARLLVCCVKLGASALNY